jgi:hypothetical protein
MPDYRLKNGKIVTVKEEDVQSFMNSKHGEGAVLIEVKETKPVKTEAVAKKDATVTAVNEVIDTGLASENGSLESTEVDPNLDRYINYTKNGKEVVTYEDDYIDKARKTSNPLSFDDYAKSLDVNIVESIASPVIKAESRDTFIQEALGAKAYLPIEELGGFNFVDDKGVRKVIKNNEQTIQQIADKINGINYSNQNDYNLDGLDSFAKNNQDKPIIVYNEGSDGPNYKESIQNITTLNQQYYKLKQKQIKEGLSYQEVKTKDELEKKFNSDYDIHMDRFKTTNSNVEFITTKDISKKRLNYQGNKVRQEIVKDKELKTVLDDYNDFGLFYLSPKELEISKLNKKLKDPSLKNRKEIEEEVKKLKDGLGEDLYDPITGKTYNLKRDADIPSSLIKSYEKSESLAAKNDIDYLKDLSFDKQTRLIGVAKDLYSILSDEEYVTSKGGYGAAKNKRSLDILKYIVDNNKLPEDLTGLQDLLTKSAAADSFYNLAPVIGDEFNNTLNDYLEINRAINTNTNLLTSKENQYFTEFFDSLVNKFGYDINTKAERQGTLVNNFLEAGFTEKSVDELNKGNELNIGQSIMRGTPDLAEFVLVDLALFKGITGNGLARLGRYTQKFINTAYKGHKYTPKVANLFVPALVEGAEFTGSTLLRNLVRGEDESALQSGLAGFSMGIGGKLVRGAFGQMTKWVGTTSLPGKLAEYSFVRGIGDSKLLAGAYKNFTSATGGAGAFISGNILLGPLDFEYNKIGEMLLEESGKMFFLGKFQNAMRSPKGSIRKAWEDIQTDILSFSDLNPTAYKAANMLNMSTSSIKKPTEDSNNQIDKAWQRESNKVTKKLIKKEIDQEQANAELAQLDGAKKALEVQVGINQQKVIINQAIKDGFSVSKGEQYVIGKKLDNKGFQSLTPTEVEKLSIMSPESVVINSGNSFSKLNIENAKERIDLASQIDAILNGEVTYISSKKGTQLPTGTRAFEFKSPSDKSKQKITDFLIKQYIANVTLFELTEVNKDGFTIEQLNSLESDIVAADFVVEQYRVGGKSYENLQSELRGETYDILNKDYLDYIRINGNDGKIIRHSTTESFREALTSEDVTAGFDPSTGERHIDMEVAMNIKDIAVIAHEETHFILKDVLKNERGKVTPEGMRIIDSVIDNLKPSDAKLVRDEAKARYEDLGNKRNWYEENLTVFVELVKEGKINKDKNFVDSMLRFALSLKKNRFKNLQIDGNTSEGLFNMLEGFARGEKQSIKAAREFADKQEASSTSKRFEGTVPSKRAKELKTELEDLVDREFEMDEGDFEAQKSNLELKIRQAEKPSVKKEISTKEKSAPKKVYDNEGLIETIKSKDPKITGKEKALAEADLTESFDALALKAIKYDTRKGDYDRNEIKDYLREFFPRVVESFDPSKSKFSTWVTNNMAPKAQQTYEKFRKIADKSLDVEAGGVGSVKEMSGDVNTLYGSDSKSSDLKDSTQKMIKATSFGPVSDPVILETVENIIDIKEGERPNFKSLNNKNFDKVSEAIFGISGKKARGNATLKYDKSGGSSEANSLQNVFKNDSDVRKFIKTMPDYNIATKETVVNEQGETIDVSRDTYGRSIGINPKVLAIFYDKVDGAIPGISSPNGRSLGKTTQTDVYKLKPEFTGNISPSSVAKLQSLIGINKGTLSIPIKGEARTEFGSILTGLTKMYIDNVINTVGRSKLDSNQAKADLGAGKSSLMFSKNIKGVVREQEIINNLGLQPGNNRDSLLEIQFSKKKRAEYESILMKNRPDLPNIPKQVESLLDWADKLNVPENKKNKYKQLALYYTAKGYTRFPEDGYKIEEVVRISDKNKIDPYAYSNPDELINKFTEEVKTSKVNPDNMPELTDKQEFGDGVTVYNVVDSRKGQRAVRSIVDSNWGENANPWCLIARTKQKLIASFKTESEAKVFAENNKNKLSDLSIKFEPNARKWTVIKPVDPKNIMNIAWTHWQQYNRNATGYGYKIAFQNGKLLSLRDGGEGDSDMVETFEEVKWWDRFDKPTENLTVDLGKDKNTGYKIIGSIDYEGNFDITGYGEGDFMSKTSDFKLYDADKSLIEQKDFKDGNVSFWLKNEPTKMNDGGRAVTKIESKYTDGVFDSSISTVKDLRTGNIVTKSTISHTTLSKDSYIKEEIVVGKNGRSPTAPKVTTKTIKIINSSGQTTRNIDTFYDERITDGVSVVNTDRMAELESIKKPFIRFSKSVNKAAKSNNDMLPKSQRLKGEFTNQDVLDRMGDLDKKANEAELKFSKRIAPNLDKEFNDIIEKKTGIASNEIITGAKARLMGKKKGRFDIFIPPAAEDFVGLLYATLGKGTVGDSQMRFYKDNLLNPYARGIENITRDRNNLGRNFKALKKDLKIIPKDLKKNIKGSLFTKEQAVRVYIWEQIGKDVPGLSETDVLELVTLVESDPNLKLFAQEVMKLGKGRPYVAPTETWETGNITTDLLESLNTKGRKEYLELWQQNSDIIFSDKNMDKLQAAFGKSYRVAMDDMLRRMKSGRNRAPSKQGGRDETTERFVDWINGGTAGIMFFNTRSAVLQTLSTVNFINFGDNNIIAAGRAFADQTQYWKDFKTLWNSEFLVERRDGLKINVNEADIADVAKESGARGVINKLLKLGFTPTQLADSFAIAAGGSTFYRNRLKALVKEGMDPIAANKQAMRDFREIAEETQQSSRPDKISKQQAGELGRIVLAFANTPAQYARKIKKSASDLKNGRGDAKTHIARILYYSVAQNFMFNALQQAMFAVMFGEEDVDEDSILEEKTVKTVNGMIDGIARGTGIRGAIFTVVKNAGVKIYEQTQKKNPNYENIADEILKISPPISSKYKKMKSAGRSFTWNMDDVKSKGFSLDNPAYLAVGNVVSASTNIPLDRVVKKLNNLVAASDAEVETYKRLALTLGWSKWELGITDEEEEELGPVIISTRKVDPRNEKGFGGNKQKGFGGKKGF